jgi:protein-L-isoaspartate(D-aspartate) O-methyltransferase
MIRVVRTGQQFEATVISFVAIFLCLGSIEQDTDERAAGALKRNDSESIRSIRRDAHDQEDSCWLHDSELCISRNRVEKEA